MHIARCDFYAKDKTSAVAGCVSFVGKLPLVLSLYKHSAFRIRCGHSLLYRSTAGGILRFIVVFVFFNRLLAQLLSLCIYLTA